MRARVNAPAVGAPCTARPTPPAAQAAAEAMARFDGTSEVLATVREALRPVDAASGQVRTRDAVDDDLRAAT